MVDLSKLWQKRDVMNVVTVDGLSGKVIMLGYMNKEAFAYTLKTGKVWYYKPDSKKIRMKGKHSGNVQKLISIKTDYDYKNLLITVEQVGTACPHDGGHSTYFIHNIYGTDDDDRVKRKKFGKVEIDENFDFSKEDYEDEYDD